MHQFIETIRLQDGQFGNLAYHQQRMNLAREEFFSASSKIDLSEFLNSCPMPSIGLHKVRLVYDKEIQSIQISSYQPKIINKLKIIFSDSIVYQYKFEDRSNIENLYSQRGECDDIIIVNGNKITDASFANLVFKKNGKWFTPSTYLLNGTMRQFLIDQKMIFEEEISINDLPRFEKVKLINAMLRFDAREIDVSQIVQ